MRESQVHRSLRAIGWVWWIVIGLMMTTPAGLVFAQDADDTADKPKGKPTRHRLTIMHTSDLYGRLRDFRCKRPGALGVDEQTNAPVKRDLANLLHQVKTIQDQVGKAAARSQMLALNPGKGEAVRTAGWLLFNTGDNLATDLTARFLLEFKGIAGVDFMAETFERFSYQLVGIGNHEFSVKAEKLQEFLMQASLKNVKFAVANLEDAYEICMKQNKETAESNKQEKDPKQRQKLKECKQYPKHALMRYIGNKKRYTIFRKGSIKIGVFHLVPKDLQLKVAGPNVRGIAFSDPAAMAGRIAEKLRTEEKVDLVVMLSHLETSSSRGKNVRALLSANTEENQRIDLVITNELRESGNPTGISTFDKKGNGIYIVGAAKYGSQLGRVDLVIEKHGSKSRVLSFQSKSIPLTDRFEPELRRELIKWERSYCKRWGTPLGSGRIRTQEGMTRDQFITYMLNLMRYMATTEVAIINDGAVRPGRFFPIKGYVTKDDLFRALPFNGKLMRLELKGQQLNDLLKFAGEDAKRRRLRFIGADGGNVNGRNIDAEATYSVVTTSYVANNRGRWLEKAPTGAKLFIYNSVMYKDKSFGCNPTTMKKYSIKNLCIPRTRDTMQLHFETNAFRKLPPTPPPKPSADDDATGSLMPQRRPNQIPVPRLASNRRVVAGSAGGVSSLPRNGRLVAQTDPKTPADPKTPTDPPADTDPPAKTPAATDPPATDPPATDPPATDPPASDTKTPAADPPAAAVKKKGKPKAKPFGKNEIPYTGGFMDLRDRVAWKLKTRLQGGFTSIFISPVNISSLYAQQENMSGGFYQKYTIEVQGGLDFQVDTRIHLWKTTLEINYNADLSLQFGQDPQSPVFPGIFQESNDRTKLLTEYRIRYFSALFQDRKWYHTDPFFELSAETEITTGTRPDIYSPFDISTFNALSAAGVNEVFHHLLINGKAGLSFQFTEQLTFKVGFTVQKQFAPGTVIKLQGCQASGTNNCLTRDPGRLSINTDLNLGFSVEYELQQWEIFKLGKTPVSWASKGEYKLTFLVGRQSGFDIHDFRWENAFSFNIVGSLSLSLGFKLFLFKGIFKPDQEQNRFIRGPLAFRIDPFVRLNFQWSTRGQAF